MSKKQTTLNKNFRGQLIALRYTRIAVLMIGFLLLLYWSGIAIHQFFTSKPTQLNINLTDFKSLDIKSSKNCKDYYFTYPFSVSINDLASNYNSLKYSMSSNEPIEVNIALPSEKITAKEFSTVQVDGNSISFFNSSRSFSGTVGKIDVEISNASVIQMDQFVCSPEIVFTQDVTSPYWNDYTRGESSLNGIAIRQWLQDGNVIKIVLRGNINLINYPTQGVNKIEILIETNNGSSFWDLQATSPGLMAELPALYRYSINSSPSVVTWKNVSINADEVKIELPKGKIRLANETPLDIENEVNNPNGELLIPHYFSINGHVNGDYQVSTITKSVILNDEELIKSPWQKISSEAQVGIIGLILTAIGGIWGLWQVYDTKRLKRFKYQPGDFVCVTKTGMTITGDLLRKPGRNFPYYIIKNARKKPSPSSSWDEEIISEIKIHADAVEQSYVA